MDDGLDNAGFNGGVVVCQSVSQSAARRSRDETGECSGDCGSAAGGHSGVCMHAYLVLMHLSFPEDCPIEPGMHRYR